MTDAAGALVIVLGGIAFLMLCVAVSYLRDLMAVNRERRAEAKQIHAAISSGCKAHFEALYEACCPMQWASWTSNDFRLMLLANAVTKEEVSA